MVGAFASHIDDILFCGRPDALAKIRGFLEAGGFQNASGGTKPGESPLKHVGVEEPQENDFSVKLNQEEFAKNLNPLITSTGQRAARQRTLSPGDIQLRKRKFGQFCWLGAVPKPDTCAGLARIASRANSLQGSDVYRISDLAKTA